MAQVDFYSMLSGLGDTIEAKRKEAARREAFANINNPDGTVDFQKAILGLTRAGDVDGAARISQLAGAAEDRRFRREEAVRAQSNADRSYGLQLQAFNRKEEPDDVRKLRAAGIDPKSPEGRKALFPKTDTPISATDKKAVMEAEDTIPQVQGTIENLTRALELNPKTFTGLTAGARGVLGTQVPGGGMIVDKNAALATSEWQKIMGPEALQAMASTLKGATTDFELRKFIEMLGDQATAPSVREGVIKRMLTLSQRKLEIQNRRVKELRTGDYYKATGAAPVSSGITKEQYDALPSGATYTAPDGSQRVKK